jgi:hypothetical protein
MKLRLPELIGKIFSDENGLRYDGQRFIKIPNPNMPTGFQTTEINYLHGKIHGSPAIVYPDGQEEEWNDGNFVQLLALPYSQRCTVNELTNQRTN